MTINLFHARENRSSRKPVETSRQTLFIKVYFMKKIKLSFLAITVVAICSAFATNVSTGLKSSVAAEYYFDSSTGSMVLITTAGHCALTGDFCKYTLIPGQPDDGNPIHYTGVPGTENQHWIP